MTPRHAVPVVAAVLAAAVAFWALRPAAPSPEDGVRALVAGLADAAEHRDVAAFGDRLDEGFHGPGLSKAELKQMLLGHFLRSREPLTVLNPSLSVEVRSPTEARFSGTFIFSRGAPGAGGGEGLGRYLISGQAVRQGRQWVVTEAEWHQP